MTRNSHTAQDVDYEVGLVVKAKRYLLTLEGLPSARVNDVLVDADGNRAIVRALSDDYVYALALTQAGHPGDQFHFFTEEYHYSAGPHLFGRVIDTLGRPVDNKGSFPPPNVSLRLEVDAQGIEVRRPIHTQLVTGITAVDTLIPIAKGQRQLVFGPMRSGKTTFLTQTVQEQAARGVVCIYAVIGKPINGLRKITNTIIEDAPEGAKTVVIAAVSDEPASVIALTPSIAFLLAEYYQSLGEDVLVVLDDLDAHAKYLREIALLEGRLPSTESYPGDIFYQHAHLMERSGHFTDAVGGGSITALPVIQTDLKNFSDLIPTNVMACTDGHLAFSPTLRAQGSYPSINIAESVTRVGRQAQHTLQKQATRHTQVLLGSYRTQQEYAKFSTDLSDHTRDILRRGAIIEVLLEQPPYKGLPFSGQVLLLALVFSDYFSAETDAEAVEDRKEALTHVLCEADEFAELRERVTDDSVSWDELLEEIRAQHDNITHYVSNS
jgi:F-type H+-transporting ATPase subunit alpha